jgi:hypothetical protein
MLSIRSNKNAKSLLWDARAMASVTPDYLGKIRTPEKTKEATTLKSSQEPSPLRGPMNVSASISNLSQETWRSTK